VRPTYWPLRDVLAWPQNGSKIADRHVAEDWPGRSVTRVDDLPGTRLRTPAAAPLRKSSQNAELGTLQRRQRPALTRTGGGGAFNLGATANAPSCSNASHAVVRAPSRMSAAPAEGGDRH
jgi:hypothetical protein